MAYAHQRHGHRRFGWNNCDIDSRWSNFDDVNPERAFGCDNHDGTGSAIGWGSGVADGSDRSVESGCDGGDDQLARWTV